MFACVHTICIVSVLASVCAYERDRKITLCACVCAFVCACVCALAHIRRRVCIRGVWCGAEAGVSKETLKVNKQGNMAAQSGPADCVVYTGSGLVYLSMSPR